MLRRFLLCFCFFFLYVSAILCASFGDYFPSLETYQEHIRKMGTDYDHNIKIQGCIDPFCSFIKSWKSQNTEHRGKIQPPSSISSSLSFSVFVSTVYSTAFALNSHNKDEIPFFLFFPFIPASPLISTLVCSQGAKDAGIYYKDPKWMEDKILIGWLKHQVWWCILILVLHHLSHPHLSIHILFPEHTQQTDGYKKTWGKQNKQTNKKNQQNLQTVHFFEVVRDDMVFVNILFRCLVLQVSSRATILWEQVQVDFLLFFGLLTVFLSFLLPFACNVCMLLLNLGVRPHWR